MSDAKRSIAESLLVAELTDCTATLDHFRAALPDASDALIGILCDLSLVSADFQEAQNHADNEIAWLRNDRRELYAEIGSQAKEIARLRAKIADLDGDADHIPATDQTNPFAPMERPGWTATPRTSPQEVELK